jgi:Tol biopolymer transport system component
MKTSLFRIVVLTLAAAACAGAQPSHSLRLPSERHLQNIRQLTFAGENAEAYLSCDESKLVFQSTRPPYKCDQIFTMTTAGDDVRLVSSGTGRTTCAYYLPGDTTILYASTYLASPDCPPPPDFSKGYIWALYHGYDIFVSNLAGTSVRRLTTTDGYDAEATISPLGDRIVFTSVRNGDLDIYTMNLDGTDVRQLTHEPGYDGGAFFSPDGKQIVYRGFHPTDSTKLAQYRELLAEGFVRPSVMEIMVMDADGGNKRQITHANAASFAPYFHPDGKHIIFSSNMKDPKGRNFDLFMINVDGTGLEQITFNDTFDGFPMFTRDGKRLIFESNRNARTKGDTNIFTADWIP